MVNRMRATRAHRDNRRSHHALSEARFSKCENCGSVKKTHLLCPNCGQYRGKKIIDMNKALVKKDKKSKKKAESSKK